MNCCSRVSDACHGVCNSGRLENAWRDRVKRVWFSRRRKDVKGTLPDKKPTDKSGGCRWEQRPVSVFLMESTSNYPLLPDLRDRSGLTEFGRFCGFLENPTKSRLDRVSSHNHQCYVPISSHHSPIGSSLSHAVQKLLLPYIWRRDPAHAWTRLKAQ